MAAGPGSEDAQGIWQYGEDDLETLMSDLLNIGQQSVSAALALILSRLSALEDWKARMPFALAGGRVSATQAGTLVTFPVGKFTVPPLIVLGPAWNTATGGTGNPALVKYNGSTTTEVTIMSTTAAAVVVDWMAIQMTSVAAAG